MKRKREEYENHFKSYSFGFTLAELLVVVAIIAVIALVSIPVFASKLEGAKEESDIANMRAAKAAANAMYLDGKDLDGNLISASGFVTYFDAQSGTLKNSIDGIISYGEGTSTDGGCENYEMTVNPTTEYPQVDYVYNSNVENGIICAYLNSEGTIALGWCDNDGNVLSKKVSYLQKLKKDSKFSKYGSEYGSANGSSTTNVQTQEGADASYKLNSLKDIGSWDYMFILPSKIGKVNDKIVIVGDVNVPANTTAKFTINQDKSVNSSQVYANEWTTIYSYTSISQENADTTFIRLYTNDKKLNVGDIVSIKNVMVYNLTEIFGSGNEPNLNEFKRLLKNNYMSYKDKGIEITYAGK